MQLFNVENNGGCLMRRESVSGAYFLIYVDRGGDAVG